jgi:hypothetical protein
VPRAIVPDAATQRAVTAIITAIQSIIQFLRPFKQPEPWKALPLESGVTSYNPSYQIAQYRKDAMGRVHVRGEVAVSGAHGGNHVLAVLPIGYRPPAALNLIIADNSSGSTIGVESTGQVVHINGAHTQVSLNFSFDSEA